MTPPQETAWDADHVYELQDAPPSYLELLSSLERRISVSGTMTQPSRCDSHLGLVSVKGFLSRALFEAMCCYPQLRTRLISMQDCMLPILVDHPELFLTVYMTRQNSPMEDDCEGPETKSPDNTSGSPSRRSGRLFEPTPQRAAQRARLLSPYPETPTQTPTLSNDVPIGAVSSKKLIQGLQAVQDKMKDGVVVQSRFGTPVEGEPVRERMSRSAALNRQWEDSSPSQSEEDPAEALKKRVCRAKDRVKDWNDGAGDEPADTEMEDQPPSDHEHEDQRFSDSEARRHSQSDKGKGREIVVGEDARKAEEEKRRRDSAWKSRQGSLADPPGPAGSKDN